MCKRKTRLAFCSFSHPCVVIADVSTVANSRGNVFKVTSGQEVVHAAHLHPAHSRQVHRKEIAEEGLEYGLLLGMPITTKTSTELLKCRLFRGVRRAVQHNSSAVVQRKHWRQR